MIYGNALWRLERGPGGGAPIGVTRKPWRKIAKVVTTGGRRGALLRDAARTGRGRARASAPDRRRPLRPLRGRRGRGAVAAARVPRDARAPRRRRAAPARLLQELGAHVRPPLRRPSQHRQGARGPRHHQRAVREPENAGKILVTSGKWERTSDSPTDSGVVELLLLSREEVAAAYTIPPPVLGILDRAIKSNVESCAPVHPRLARPARTEITDDIDAQLTFQTPGGRRCASVHVRGAAAARPGRARARRAARRAVPDRRRDPLEARPAAAEDQGRHRRAVGHTGLEPAVLVGRWQDAGPRKNAGEGARAGRARAGHRGSRSTSCRPSSARGDRVDRSADGICRAHFDPFTRITRMGAASMTLRRP
jgi:hypothetical protein